MSLLQDLQEAVCSANVQTDSQALAPLLVDNRNRFFGQVLCACFPASTEEVARVMAICHRHAALVFTQGGNTGNCAAATPVVSEADARRSVLISLRRMRSIERVDPLNDTITVEAGAILQDVRDAAEDHGRLFPVSLAAQGSCTIGGLLSTNAGGVHVVRYGNMREQCLGLEVVLSDGRVLDMLRGLRKDNTGYDLKHLFIGSEGTIGVITRAQLKLSPLPVARSVYVLAFSRLSAAGNVFNALHALFGPQLSAFELMHVDTIRMVARELPQIPIGFDLSAPWYVLVECEYNDVKQAERLQSAALSVLENLLEDGTLSDATLAQSEAQCEALWRVRESIPSAHKHAGGNVKHDISVQRNDLADFVETTNARLQSSFEWIAPSVFGHFGDGNLHYNMGVREGFDRRLCFKHEEAIHAIVYDAVKRFNGSVAAEHGVGRLKTRLLNDVKSPEELHLMRLVKRVFDSDNRLNPGAVIDLKESIACDD